MIKCLSRPHSGPDPRGSLGRNPLRKTFFLKEFKKSCFLQL